MFDDRIQIDAGLDRFGGLLEAALSLDDVVAALIQAARQIIGCDSVSVVLRDNGCCHYVAEDALEPLWKGQRFPLEACVSGWAMLNGKTAIVPDVALDPRVPVAPYQTKSIRSLVMVPIGSPEPVAAVGAYWCAHVFIGEETVACVEAMARQAADALTRIRGASPVKTRAARGTTASRSTRKPAQSAAACSAYASARRHSS
jgi:L-methionine (R)-S-oxide reductase